MKKFKNYLWIILGITIIILGIVLPLNFFNQDVYYTQTSDVIFGEKTYEFTVTSNKDIEVNEFRVEIEYLDGEIKTYTINSFGRNHVGDEYTYEFSFEIEQYTFIKDLSIFAVGEKDFEIQEKHNETSKLPIMLISCVVGVALIAMFFINKKSNSEKEEIKNNDLNKENITEKPLYRTCDYCGNPVDINSTTCSSCGAKQNIIK